MTKIVSQLLSMGLLATALWPAASARAGCAPVAALAQPSSGILPPNPILYLFLTTARKAPEEIAVLDGLDASLPVKMEPLWSGDGYKAIRIRVTSGEARRIILSVQWRKDYPGTRKWEYTIDPRWKQTPSADPAHCCKTQQHGDLVEVNFVSKASAFRMEWAPARSKAAPSPAPLVPGARAMKGRFSIAPSFRPSSSQEDGRSANVNVAEQVAVFFGAVPCLGRTTDAGIGSYWLRIIGLNADGSEEVVTPHALRVSLTSRSRCSAAPGRPGWTVCSGD
jgi:hypothetical protein